MGLIKEFNKWFKCKIVGHHWELYSYSKHKEDRKELYNYLIKNPLYECKICLKLRIFKKPPL